MISKGGKITYVCSSCKSPHIVNTKKGVSIQGVKSYVSVPANSCLCINCGGYTKWSARLKVKVVKADSHNGLLSLDDYSRLVSKIDSIGRIKVISTLPSSSKKPKETVSHKPFVPPLKRGDQTELGIEWSPRGVEDLTHWTHRPQDFGVWVAYNSWRFKDAYDIMLKDGTIEKMCYPNADKFSNSNGTHSEYDVIAVRLCDYEDVKDNWRAGGDTKEESDEYRARRNSTMFAGDDSTKASWDKVKVIRFDPETRQLVDDDVTTMERAHQLFNSEEAKAKLLMLKEEQLSDEEMLERYFPTYITDANESIEKLKLHGMYGGHGDIGRGHVNPIMYHAPSGHLPFHVLGSDKGPSAPVVKPISKVIEQDFMENNNEE